uniref:MULE transposase domain-containing protein n=1 Tax=Peronospora matthiolae TaxID=2874970 RepID=A0AAV1SZG5_9STRA
MFKSSAAPKVILTTLRQQDPQIYLTSKDISNVKARLLREDLNDRTPLEALLDELQEKEVMHDYAKDDEGRITHPFFATPSAVDRAREFPDVVSMDFTYKTNRFKLPLLHVVGMTSTNATFSICFCFMSGETK